MKHVFFSRILLMMIALMQLSQTYSSNLRPLDWSNYNTDIFYDLNWVPYSEQQIYVGKEILKGEVEEMRSLAKDGQTSFQHSMILYNLSKLYGYQGRINDRLKYAVSVYENCKEFYRHDKLFTLAALNMAECQYDFGYFDQALKYGEKALNNTRNECDPVVNMWVKLFVAKAYYEVGSYGKACEVLDELLKNQMSLLEKSSWYLRDALITMKDLNGELGNDVECRRIEKRLKDLFEDSDAKQFESYNTKQLLLSRNSTLQTDIQKNDPIHLRDIRAVLLNNTSIYSDVKKAYYNSHTTDRLLQLYSKDTFSAFLVSKHICTSCILNIEDVLSFQYEQHNGNTVITSIEEGKESGLKVGDTILLFNNKDLTLRRNRWFLPPLLEKFVRGERIVPLVIKRNNENNFLIEYDRGLDPKYIIDTIFFNLLADKIGEASFHNEFFIDNAEKRSYYKGVYGSHSIKSQNMDVKGLGDLAVDSIIDFQVKWKNDIKNSLDVCQKFMFEEKISSGRYYNGKATPKLNLEPDSKNILRNRLFFNYVVNSIHMGDSININAWETVKNRLKPNQVSVTYYENGLTLYAIIVRKEFDSPYVVEIPYFAFRLYNEDLYNEYLGPCYRSLWGELSKYIRDGEEVFMTNTQTYTNLNIELLKDPEGQRIMDKYQIHRIYSPLEINSDNHLLRKGRALLVGNLYYSRSIKELASERNGWNYLPGTKIEIDSIKKLLDGGFEVETVEESRGNEEAIRYQLCDKSTAVVHFSTHGFCSEAWDPNYVNRLQNMRPRIQDSLSVLQKYGLLLSNCGDKWVCSAERGKNDGLLTIDEILDMNLSHIELCVLSACNTGSGSSIGFSTLNLPYALKIAGVKNVIYTTSEIDDVHTAQFMKALYSYLSKGESVYESYRLCQREMISLYKDDPKYWCPFILLE